MKYIAIFITTVVLAYSQTISEPSDKDEMHLYIYHPSKAFIEETREVVFSTKGNNLLKINNLPLSTNPKSIMVQSSKFETKTKELVYNPITQNTLLKSYLGKEITVEKYNDNGETVYSKTAKLISFNDKPIFNIDGEIITSSAFEYIFPEIPNSLNDIPYLLLNGSVTKKKTDITFSYIANQFGWSADYDLLINSDDTAEISGWYNVWNHSNIDYKNVDVSLISGDINQIPSRQQGGRSQLASASFLEKNSQRDDFRTDTQKLDDYVVFNIVNPISLSS